MKRLFLLALVFSLAANGANYSARRSTRDGVDVIILSDAARHTEVTVVPSIGNVAYEMKVNGKNVLRTSALTLAQFKAKPSMVGIPFLWPWANRIDQDAYYVNGKKYAINSDLKNASRDQNKHPMHGLVTYSSAWSVVSTKADRRRAEVTSRLEFWKYPDLMAQFPFAHTVEMTYRLTDGVLEVQTLVRNHAAEPMPVSMGFHSYFRVDDAPADQWTLHIAARDHLVLNRELMPTGERKPVEFPDPYPLAGKRLDDLFANLIRGADGRAEFWLQGKAEKVSVLFGPKYDVAVVFTTGRDTVAIEAMSAITNAFNLAQAGTYKDLQMIPPGGEWRESFWVRPTGF
jgi:aldose 1-epimerase